MKLGDICSKIGSGATPRGGKESYKDSGTPIIRSQNVLDWSFSSDGLAYLDDEQACALSNVEVKPRDVLLNITGDSVARACIVPNEFTPARVNQHVSILRTNSRSNPVFLLAWLQTNKSLLLSLASSGATRNALTKTMLEKLDVNLPPIDVQERIAGIVLSIQSKIETNAKLNGYLEELADSLFKRRFGGLPDNASLSDTADITMGQSPVGSSYNEDGVGTVFYQGRAEFGWRYPSQRLSTTEPKRMARCGDVLMSVRAPVGDLNIAFEDCCIGRGLAAIHSEHPSFCLYLMRSLHGKLDAFNGEGTVFGSINGRALKSLPIALPEAREIQAFEKEAFPIDALIRDNELQSRFLVALRDALLPRLMSGEIDVSKVALI